MYLVWWFQIFVPGKIKSRRLHDDVKKLQQSVLVLVRRMPWACNRDGVVLYARLRARTYLCAHVCGPLAPREWVKQPYVNIFSNTPIFATVHQTILVPPTPRANRNQLLVWIKQWFLAAGQASRQSGSFHPEVTWLPTKNIWLRSPTTVATRLHAWAVSLSHDCTQMSYESP